MPNRKMRRVGTVVRDANDKTIVVAYAWSQTHRIYKRSRRRITKFVAHDEHNEASIGDRVEIEECRPYSATKRWRLCRIIAQVDVVIGTEAPEAVSESDVQSEETTAQESVAEVTEAPTSEEATPAPEAEPQSAEATDATDTSDTTAVPEAAAATEEEPSAEVAQPVAAEEQTAAEDAQPVAQADSQTDTAETPSADQAEQQQESQQQ